MAPCYFASIVNICYNDRPRKQVIWDNLVYWQESNDDYKLGRNYVAGPISMASRNHLWTRRVITRSQVKK